MLRYALVGLTRAASETVAGVVARGRVGVVADFIATFLGEITVEAVGRGAGVALGGLTGIGRALAMPKAIADIDFGVGVVVVTGHASGLIEHRATLSVGGGAFFTLSWVAAKGGARAASVSVADIIGGSGVSVVAGYAGAL